MSGTGNKGRGPNRARAVSAKKIARQRAAERQRKALLASLVAGAVLVAAVIIGVAVYNTRDKAPDQFAIPKSATAAGVPVGQSAATTTIDLYVDYLCPHCKEFEEQAGPTLDKLIADGTAKLVYHPLAILDGASTTDYSTRAASAAGCAADAGAFDKYSKALFANQPAENGPGLSNDQLVALGKQAGITSPDFGTCVTDQRYADWVTALTETASKNGVTGTPTVLVNGEKIETPTVEALTAAVEKATTSK